MVDTMKQKLHTLLGGHGALLLILVLLLGAGWVHRVFLPSAASPRQAPGYETRVVVVVDDKTQTSTPSELHATLVAGTLDRGSRQAVVWSDSDCTPDDEGISHCLNELLIADSKVTIRHSHRMAQIPCLRPGETVTVVAGTTRSGTDSRP